MNVIKVVQIELDETEKMTVLTMAKDIGRERSESEFIGHIQWLINIAVIKTRDEYK